ncbi:hypothetical protein BC937DRAFT_88491 [Endogone sp. FLAS-F59071]|nr:hypothetical protein BC937DRAFT_88491 [Endogone sp. FLAS-F59071]|eukprot:RUS18657.1 hypothetical protein BC937DRAFT_88491 [Endogone sp. FLAS-F59071]
MSRPWEHILTTNKRNGAKAEFDCAISPSLPVFVHFRTLHVFCPDPPSRRTFGQNEAYRCIYEWNNYPPSIGPSWSQGVFDCWKTPKKERMGLLDCLDCWASFRGKFRSRECIPEPRTTKIPLKGISKNMLSVDQEIDRLNFQHSVIKLVRKANFEAPVEFLLRKGIKVLDVGCGSGIWLLEMAAEYPNSTFFGVDVSEMYPKEGIPPNCTFQQADVLKGLPFADDEFDFVFQRFMILAFTKRHWEADVMELVRVTRPGGFVELFEMSFVLTQAPPAYARFFNAGEASDWDFRAERFSPSQNLLNPTVSETTKARGMDITLQHDLTRILSAGSLVNIRQKNVECPIGWGGSVGDLMLENMRQLFEAMKPILLIAMGLKDVDYKIVEDTLGDFEKHQTRWTGFGAFGTKPYIL